MSLRRFKLFLELSKRICLGLVSKLAFLMSTFVASCFAISHKSTSNSLRNVLLRFAGLKVGRPAFIDKGFRVLCPSNICIGHNVSLGHDNHIWAFTPVEIGHHTITAKDVLIISGSHSVATLAPLENQSVTIGPGCWIGARVTVCGGVTIGKGCVIGAGSLVRTSIPDWSVAVGVPARVIKTRDASQKQWNHFGDYDLSDLDR